MRLSISWMQRAFRDHWVQSCQFPNKKTVCVDSWPNPSLEIPVYGKHPRVLLKYRLWFSETGMELLISFEVMLKIWHAYSIWVQMYKVPVWTTLITLLLPRGRQQWPTRPWCGSFQTKVKPNSIIIVLGYLSYQPLETCKSLENTQLVERWHGNSARRRSI